jgi:tetratricopeptide (TPR) repeat protein
MGRAKSAVQDLLKVVELKPDFSSVSRRFRFAGQLFLCFQFYSLVKARLQLANVYLKQGLFDDAKANYDAIVSRLDGEEVRRLRFNNNFDFEKLKTEKGNAEALERLGLIQTIKEEAEQADAYERRRDYQPAIDLYTKILEVGNV